MFQPPINASARALGPDPSVGEAILDRAVVINDFSSMGGGATAVALDSMRLLSARKVAVTFLAGDDGRCDLPPQIEIVALGGSHILAGNRLNAAIRGLHNRAAEQLVARWIADRYTPGTVYHLHGWSKILSPSVFRALKPVASRLVISAHDFFLSCPNGGYFNFRRGSPCSLRPLGIRCLASSCDQPRYSHKVWRFLRQVWTRALSDLGGIGAILVVHEGMTRHLEFAGIPRRQLLPVRNPVTPWHATRIQAECNKTFVFVGRLDPDKWVDLLAEAARRANVPLRMIGDGALRNLIASRFPEIELVGWKSHLEVADRLSDVRALVMPTRCREPFGIVAVQALKSGLPILISNHAMIAEEVVAAGFGLACDPCDMNALVAALKYLYVDDARIKEMSCRGHAESAWFAPSPHAWIEQLLSIYARVLRKGLSSRPAV
jgi:glycosyltransferase involved in cell wall biosynthesis